MPLRKSKVNCLATHSGFTLIEVLVAMLVLAVGILGVAGMQITALKNLQSSGSYGVAAMLANDMADRMWVNSAQALANKYNHTSAPNSPPDCVANTCTALQMARFDKFDWQQQIVGYTRDDDIVVPAMLTAGQGSVARIGTSNDFTITLRWDDDRSGSDGANCPPQSADDLDCYSLTVTM